MLAGLPEKLHAGERGVAHHLRSIVPIAKRHLVVIDLKRLDLSPLIVAGAGNLAYEVDTAQLEIEPADERFKSDRQHVFVYEKQPDGTWKVAVGMSGNS